jgi:UDP-N-acetylglucosamine 2-epimerase (non-hydrolysing)
MSVRLDCVVGARPNFMKMAAVFKEIRRRPHFRARLIHTGQHYSPEMSEAFFRELELPAPDCNLEIGQGTPTVQTAGILQRLEPLFLQDRPDAVIVVGDVNSTVAAALVAVRLGIPIAHVEAGLRSFDRGMPEEINRLVADVISDFLFVTEPSGVKNLLAEGMSSDKIFLVGNVMIDTLLSSLSQAEHSDVLERFGLDPRGYAVVTLHRPSNVDDPERFRGLLSALSELARSLPVVFPIHPRTRQHLERGGWDTTGLQLLPPLGYLDFLRLMSQARLMLTDSGGIQEETTILNVPCLTLRENTERPITVEQGTNQLVGIDPDTILAAARRSLAAPSPAPRAPDLWDGQAAHRILDILENALIHKTAVR